MRLLQGWGLYLPARFLSGDLDAQHKLIRRLNAKRAAIAVIDLTVDLRYPRIVSVGGEHPYGPKLTYEGNDSLAMDFARFVSADQLRRGFRFRIIRSGAVPGYVGVAIGVGRQ